MVAVVVVVIGPESPAAMIMMSSMFMRLITALPAITERISVADPMKPLRFATSTTGAVTVTTAR